MKMIIYILPPLLQKILKIWVGHWKKKKWVPTWALPGFSHSQDAPQRAVITPAAVFFSVCEFSYL